MSKKRKWIYFLLLALAFSLKERNSYIIGVFVGVKKTKNMLQHSVVAWPAPRWPKPSDRQAVNFVVVVQAFSFKRKEIHILLVFLWVWKKTKNMLQCCRLAAPGGLSRVIGNQSISR